MTPPEIDEDPLNGLLPDFSSAGVVAVGTIGLFIGFIHALSGPDHLAALIPLCLCPKENRPESCETLDADISSLSSTKSSGWLGLAWGCGHSFGICVLGVIFYIVKDFTKIYFFDKYTPIAVGLTIIAIGIIAIYESKTTKDKQYQHSHASHSGLSANKTYTLTFGTGIIHGVSGCGHLYGLAPAISLGKWNLFSIYLAAFSVGCVGGMGLFCLIISAAAALFERKKREELKCALLAADNDFEVDRRVKEEVEAIPRKLSFWSGVFAIVFGTVWEVVALRATFTS